MDTLSPGKRAAKSRLDIEIHEDAILVSPSRPSAMELEKALKDLDISHRRPLREIDIVAIQHGAEGHLDDCHPDGTIDEAAYEVCSGVCTRLPMRLHLNDRLTRHLSASFLLTSSTQNHITTSTYCSSFHQPQKSSRKNR